MSDAKYLLILAISLAFSSCSFSANDTKRTELPKGTVKTIYAAHGEIIDCVDYYEQPAFDHPLLKDRKHEYKNEIPECLKPHESDDLEAADDAAIQTWRQSGECPEGTVPILRQPKRDLDVVRKLKRVAGNRSIGRLDDSSEHEYAFVEVQPGRYYYGGRCVMSVWKPFIENVHDEFSLAQMWVTKGYGAALETIEAGWHSDNYEKTGCYNLDCPGFIYTNGRGTVMPGGILIPSIVNGKQSSMDISFDRDASTGDWWLKVLNQVVGRWPASLFKNLNEHADTIQWGGEIVNGDSKIHTATEMGSGHFPSEGVGKAAYMHSLQVKKQAINYGRYVNADSLIHSVTKPNCYDFKMNSIGHPYPGVNFFLWRSRIFQHLC
ncbi:hypothetical protein QQ045_011312 [Rhodiola kirilowii]